MFELGEAQRIIRTRWINRLLVYWIPAIFISYGVAEFIAAIATHRFKESMVSLCIALTFILACECLFFGFRIELFDDRLVYRYRGFPFIAEKTIKRDSIVDAKLESAIRSDHKPWTFVEVHSNLHGSETIDRINLTSFSPNDIRAVLQWLGKGES